MICERQMLSEATEFHTWLHGRLSQGVRPPSTFGMEPDNDIGLAMTSPDQVYEYEPDSSTFWAADIPSRPDQYHISQDTDSSNFSFSFSEDDLVPFTNNWSDPELIQLPASGSRPNNDERMYSQTYPERHEPKITLHRAYVLSQVPPAQPMRSPSPPERRASRISRTFQSLRRKKKRDPPPSVRDEQPSRRSRLAAVIDAPRSRSRSFSRKRGTSRGRPKTEDKSSEGSEPIAWYQRPTSIGSKMRQSLSDERQPQPEHPPLPSHTMPTGIAGQEPRIPFHTPLETLPPLPKSPVDPTIPETFPIWETLHSTADASRQERAQTLATREKREILRISGHSLGEATIRPATETNGTTKRDSSAASKDRRKSLPFVPDPTAPLSGGLSSNRAQAIVSSTMRSRRKSLKSQRKPKDEVWPKFRSLENEFSRVADRTVASKANFIESSLLPFLRNNTTETAINGIPLDLIERRCDVLQRWWTLALDLIEDWDHEKSSYISPSNAMEAITALTQRSEWRCVPETMPCQSRFPHDDEAVEARTADLIQHSYARLLLRQTAIIVGRLSVKEGAGIITRAGGVSCAYAFFFCPGVAEHLLRIWRTPSNIIKKVRESVAPETPSDISAAADAFALHFPRCVRHLRFASSRLTMTKLTKRPPQLDLEIDWNSQHWLDKWCGKRTDLFFVFLKHYHLLLADFIPEETIALERICAPGAVLVQAQIVLVTRSALGKSQSPSQTQPAAATPPATFGTLLNAYSAAVVATPPPEAVRTLAGRRMTTLIQEILDQQGSCSTHTRGLFAQSSSNALKATARQISLFDHATCYSFCDLLEHVLPSLAKAQIGENCNEDAIFWTDVFVHMLKSDNTLTALRVFSLIYTIWPEVTADQRWKQQLCHALLLSDSVFNHHFNHWSPIVRVYFMRLLAWRVARCDDVPENGDLRILKTLLFRVQQCWASYQYLRDQAIESNRLLPSTVPDNPIPGRRLLILRRDTPPSTSHGSDWRLTGSKAKRLTSPAGTGDSSLKYAQILAKLSSTLEEGLEQGRRRSALFRSLSSHRFGDGMTFASKSADVVAQDTSPSEPSSRASVWEQRRPASASGRAMSRRRKTDEDLPPYIPASFRFSLEAVEKELLPAMHLESPRLPFNAQACLEAQSNFLLDVPASKPTPAAAANAKYTGRALAEWNMTVNECTNFFERRRMEGVPSYDLVETPSLGVENFRRPG